MVSNPDIEVLLFIISTTKPQCLNFLLKIYNPIPRHRRKDSFCFNLLLFQSKHKGKITFILFFYYNILIIYIIIIVLVQQILYYNILFIILCLLTYLLKDYIPIGSITDLFTYLLFQCYLRIINLKNNNKISIIILFYLFI